MTQLYCMSCQSRLGCDRNTFQVISNEYMIRRINHAKPHLLKKLNRANNGDIAKIGDFIHKNCRVKSVYWFQNNYLPESVDIHVE